jgi:hypothetical protein
VNYAGDDDPTIDRSDPVFISRQEPVDDRDALSQEIANGKFDGGPDVVLTETDEFGITTFTKDFSLDSTFEEAAEAFSLF